MFQLGLIADRDMANRLARSSQESVGVGKQRATIESEVHVSFVAHDVAKPILKRACR